ncbi:MAG TPA: sulfite exporter TauE/SafE family protein [Candidatus Glassbacteria bacterium]|nr:sulfite exporter TauE/SafE family protein [Candidatus Glassbacteria bacterium]
MQKSENQPGGKKYIWSFAAGAAVGVLGGLMGLGGAEFRLPLLVAFFGFGTLEAIILNLLVSLVTVLVSLFFRAGTVSFTEVLSNWTLILNLLAGTLAGAYSGARIAGKIREKWLNLSVMVLLAGLGVLLVSEPFVSFARNPLTGLGAVEIISGVIAGYLIGVISSLLGVAGGELLIPTFMLLYGVEIKIAGSLALAVSFPTLIVGILKYRSDRRTGVAARERPFVFAMAAGSIAGAYLGSRLLGMVSGEFLSIFLGVLLFIAAIKIFYRNR